MHTSSSDSRLPRDSEGDDDYYIAKMNEILDEPPNIGPPAHPGKMLDHVYIGNLDNAEDYDLLPALGITHVLNVAGTRNFDLTRSRYPEKLGITDFLMIPAEDYEEYDIAEHFPSSIAFLDKAKAAGGKAMVHCNLGVNRSGAVMAAYMMVNQRKPLLQVLSELKSKRSVVLCNTGFRRQLLKYARCRGLLDPMEKSAGPKSGINKTQSHSKIDENEFRFERSGEEDSGTGITSAHSYHLDANDNKKFGSGFENGYGSADTLGMPLMMKSFGKSTSGTYVPSSVSSYLNDTDSDDEDIMQNIRLARISLSSSSNHSSSLLPSKSSTLPSPALSYPEYISGSSGSTYVSPLPDRFTAAITLPERYPSDISYPVTPLSSGMSSSGLSSSGFMSASSLSPSSTSVHPLLVSTPSHSFDNFKTTIKPRSYYHRKILGRVPRYVDFEDDLRDGVGFALDGLSESIQAKQREYDIFNGRSDYGGDDSFGLTAGRSGFSGRSALDSFAYQPRPFVETRTSLPPLNLRPRSASVTRSSELSNGSSASHYKSYQPSFSGRAGYVDDLDFDIAAYQSGIHSIPRESSVRNIRTRVTAPAAGVYPHSRTISHRW